jgi:hypothetical protein
LLLGNSSPHGILACQASWFHGTIGRPMGMIGQFWNVAMFLLAVYSFRTGLTV